MTIDIDTHTLYGFGSAIIAVLLWIGKSLARIAMETKIISVIVRTCPNCRNTVKEMDNAEDHSKI